MEFSIPFLPKLAENNGLKVCKAQVTFAERDLTYSFELEALYPGHPHSWELQSVEECDEEGHTPNLYLSLSDGYSWCFPVAADTPNGWEDATRTALADPRVKRWLELDGDPRKKFETSLLERLEQHGKVTTRKGNFNLLGHGKVVTHFESSGYYDLTVVNSEKTKTLKFYLLDEWEPILQKIITHLTVTRTEEVGYTTLAEYLRDCKECPIATEVDYDYDCGDERSYGGLSVEADLPFGKLRWDGLLVGSGGGIEGHGDEKLTLDGVELEERELPDFDVPHHYSGKGVERWEKTANETLLNDFNEWLSKEWADAQNLVTPKKD